jgi:hypothetical protein
MTNDDRSKLERRVVKAAEAAVAEQQFVTAIDVLVGVGWLTPGLVAQWRQGRIEYLERATSANLHQLSAAMAIFRRWAAGCGLQPSETAYVARTRDRRPLRFSRSGDAAIERAYRTHWISPELSDAKRQRLVEKQEPAAGPGRHLACQGLDLLDVLRQRGRAHHGGAGTGVHAMR